MKLIAFLAILLLTNPELEHPENKEAEKVQFTGTVIEELTGEPVPGATILIKEFNQEIYTDFEGNFTIENIAPGTYNLVISFVSFEKKELNDLQISGNHHSMLIRMN
jgi:hypothetical protein